MYISKSARQAYSEVLAFLDVIDESLVQKVPQKLIEFFQKEKDKDYIKIFNPNVSIATQGVLEETLALIAFLNLKYWCDTPEEKERLMKIYRENEERYIQLEKQRYEENSIFTSSTKRNDKQQFEEAKIQSNEIVTYKRESFIDNIINKIKSYFRKK